MDRFLKLKAIGFFSRDEDHNGEPSGSNDDDMDDGHDTSASTDGNEMEEAENDENRSTGANNEESAEEDDDKQRVQSTCSHSAQSHYNRTWSLLFSRLKAFHRQRGNFRIPYSPVGQRRFSQWVYEQRRLYKAGRLRQDRFEELNSIGFFGNDRESEDDKTTMSEEKEEEEDTGTSGAPYVRPSSVSNRSVQSAGQTSGMLGQYPRALHRNNQTSLASDNHIDGSDGSDGNEDEVLPPRNIFTTMPTDVQVSSTRNSFIPSPSTVVLDSTTYCDAMKNFNELIEILKQEKDYEKDELQRQIYQLQGYNKSLRNLVKLMGGCFLILFGLFLAVCGAAIMK